jgi:tRNA modification GTPase
LKQPFSNPPKVLDHALTLFFNGPKSYSGEDLLELHVHGGPAVVRAVLDSIQRVKPSSGVPIRYAEPGEFSKRAFYNGKLDMTQIEGIGSMIEAETESQRQASLEASSGHSKKVYEAWREGIVENMALLTALIDFSDDNQGIDSGEVLVGKTKENVGRLLKDIKNHLAQVQRSEILRSGIVMSLLGAPNAGKSSLLNILAKRNAAIVSEEAGTTRDVVEIGLDVAGYKVVLGDTAGLRGGEQVGMVEKEGIKRARERFQKSHMIMAVLPADGCDHSSDIIAELKQLHAAEKQIVVAINKTDLVEDHVVEAFKNRLMEEIGLPRDSIIPVSCIASSGLETLLAKLSSEFSKITTIEGSDPVLASQRVKDNLIATVIPALETFMEYDLEAVVFATEELRMAAEGIGMITGQGIGIEEVLGAVFSKFCIGK